MINIIMFLLFILGFFLFGAGLFRMISNANQKKDIVLAIIGLFIFSISLFFLTLNDLNGNDTLLQNIAEQLDTNSSEIIIEDISEESLFSPSKNENLRKVYHKDKVYLVEVKDYKVKNIVEIK